MPNLNHLVRVSQIVGYPLDMTVELARRLVTLKVRPVRFDCFFIGLNPKWQKQENNFYYRFLLAASKRPLHREEGE